MLSAEQILKADDLGDIEKVSVPEWGGDVYIKIMSGAERDYFELTAAKAVENPGSNSVRAALCSATICDDKGKRLFTNNQTASLAKKSAVALNRIYEKARALNKVTDEDIEELEGN